MVNGMFKFKEIGGVGLQATCINVDITWSDARLALSVNTALFKQLTDSPTYLNCGGYHLSDWEEE